MKMEIKYKLCILLAVLVVVLVGLLVFIFRVYPEKQIAKELPRKIYVGRQSDFHVQGIALDDKKEYMYYSFTDKIVKTDLQGNVIGSISGFAGHIGCIAFNDEDKKVYASLEYKHDDIGQSLIDGSDKEITVDDGFYVAIFDVDKIVEGDYDISEYPDMIKTVYLSEVFKDYKGTGKDLNTDTVEHKYGCSGIDGLCFAPLPGGNKRDLFLYVAYGIYSDVNRDDNDHQVILCYDMDSFSDYAQSFDQDSMHLSGPETYEHKFFVYTGNTRYGVQNMTYNKEENCLMLSVYSGRKKIFENYDLFAVDMTKKPVESELTGLDETGYILTLKTHTTAEDKTVNGWRSELGQCGMCCVGYNYFYLAESKLINGMYSADVKLFRFDEENGFVQAE